MSIHPLLALAHNLLGREVSYVQVSATNDVYDRRGIITSIHLGIDRRIQVRLADAGGQVNADLAACNLNKEQREIYLDHVMHIRARTEAIKKAQSELVTVGNAEIEKIYDKACGTAVEFILPPAGGPNNPTAKGEKLDETPHPAS